MFFTGFFAVNLVFWVALFLSHETWLGGVFGNAAVEFAATIRM